jgi:decaprenylphospho-beta-D-ribofuranose 2-oxidase
MGLTGLVLDATFRLTPIETSLLSVDTDRTPDLDSTLDLMTTGDHAYDYSVAWIDLMATGARTGRSILDRGHFASIDQLDAKARRDPLAFRSGTLATYPPVPANLITRATVKAFNEVWYRKAPRRRRGDLQTISQFFHPLDMVDRWNRVYGRTGLLQWQCAVPLDATDDLRWVVEQLSRSGRPSFLAVLKRFGPGNPGPLSFPMEGWTLALDVPASRDGELLALLDRLDERVVAAGGRLYLAKDSRMRPELMGAMYPQLDAWRKVRDAADPHRQLASDLGRRLGLLTD